MFEYELHQDRSAQLRREAAEHRLAREVVKTRRARSRQARKEGQAKGPRQWVKAA